MTRLYATRPCRALLISVVASNAERQREAVDCLLKEEFEHIKAGLYERIEKEGQFELPTSSKNLSRVCIMYGIWSLAIDRHPAPPCSAQT